MEENKKSYGLSNGMISNNLEWVWKPLLLFEILALWKAYIYLSILLF